MSQENLHISLADDLVRIHQVITRGLETARRACDQAEVNGFTSDEEREGLANYVDALIAVMDAHNDSEDNLFYPRVREGLTETPYEQMTEEHLRMDPLIDQARVAVNDVRRAEYPNEAAGALAMLLGQLSSIWGPHISNEEKYFSREAMNRTLTEEEQEQLSRNMSEYTSKQSGPDYLVYPFIIFNLPPDQRAVMARNMPPQVMDELLPVTWREQWRSMAPFFIP